jgi:hypothetical protein
MESSEHVLLTGAGFTHNFGAPLAADVWSLIFNHRSVQNAPSVRALMLVNQDFEAVYHLVRTGSGFSVADRDAVREAVICAFDTIDETVRTWLFDGRSPYQVNIYGLQRFISRFAGTREKPGFYFTLNQDLFLERHYYNGPRPNLLGVQHHPDWFTSTWSRTTPEHRRFLSGARVGADSVQGHDFLYIKLHGSSNFYTSGSRPQMVIGSTKSEQIGGDPLLASYWNLFLDVLASRKRIFVIGYGFGDEHVNQVLAASVRQHGSHLYVLTPAAALEFVPMLRSRPHGEDVLQGLRAHYQAGLAQVFPEDQSESGVLRRINTEFF